MKKEVVEANQPRLQNFLRVVVKNGNLEKTLKSIEHQQREDTDTCLSASDIAAHFIVDLYSEASSVSANVNRITMNLESVADELLRFSKAIKALDEVKA
jgi:hypothetical protein